MNCIDEHFNDFISNIMSFAIFLLFIFNTIKILKIVNSLKCNVGTSTNFLLRYVVNDTDKSYFTSYHFIVEKKVSQ